MLSLEEFIAMILERSYAGSGVSYAVADLRNFAREIVVMLPAYIGIASIVAAYLTDVLAKAAMRLLECEDVFIAFPSAVTMPKTFAAIYVTAFVLFICTSHTYNPLIYTMLKSLTYVTVLPCAAIGITSFLKNREDDYFYMNKRRGVMFALMFLVMLTLGLKASIVLFSTLGAIEVLKKPTKKSEDKMNWMN